MPKQKFNKPVLSGAEGKALASSSDDEQLQQLDAADVEAGYQNDALIAAILQAEGEDGYNSDINYRSAAAAIPAKMIASGSRRYPGLSARAETDEEALPALPPDLENEPVITHEMASRLRNQAVAPSAPADSSKDMRPGSPRTPFDVRTATLREFAWDPQTLVSPKLLTRAKTAGANEFQSISSGIFAGYKPVNPDVGKSVPVAKASVELEQRPKPSAKERLAARRAAKAAAAAESTQNEVPTTSTLPAYILEADLLELYRVKSIAGPISKIQTWEKIPEEISQLDQARPLTSATCLILTVLNSYKVHTCRAGHRRKIAYRQISNSV